MMKKAGLYISLLVSLAFVFSALGKVHATPSPYVWNNYSNSVIIKLSPESTRGTFVKNGTAVYMWCYRDANWYYGNYWTNRWYYVRSYIPYVFDGWVHASYMKLPMKVGRC
jgi:hypothetical protein